MATPETIDELRLLASLGPYAATRMPTTDTTSGVSRQFLHGSRRSA